jgi:hypothetical protein
MNEFKPSQIIYRGDRDKGVHYLKFARKLLAQTIERNEKLGQYKNPSYQYRDREKTIKVTALPGYDIIEIFVPLEGEEELPKTNKLYSGLFEPRYSAAQTDWYLRYWPSIYEVYNPDQNLDKGLGSSIDGAKVDPAMPPLRWLYNNYEAYDPDTETGLTEAPWFTKGEGVPERWILGFSAGKFSGKLRELVQLQLGMGLYPQFDHKRNGIRLETLANDKIRIWLYDVSASTGIRMQVMGDYEVSVFERANDLKPGSMPPEVEEAGFFSYQTSFSEARAEYTKAEYDALEPQPSIYEVTFTLMDASTYQSSIGSFAALGDYGWSFHPDGNKAIFVGITTNYPEGRNFKSQLFRLFFQEYVVNIGTEGEKPFLFDGDNDHIKAPDEFGNLESHYFFRADDGFIGTQPSDNYTAPMYAIFTLDGNERVVNYNYTAWEVTTDEGGAWTTWADAIACRRYSYITTNGYPTSFDYSLCTTGRTGTGSMGGFHGFSSDITTPTEEKYSYVGSIFRQQSPTPISGFMATGFWLQRSTPGGGRPYMTPIDNQFVAVYAGTMSADTDSVLVIPSFERCAFYHFKNYINSITEGTLNWYRNYVYRGTTTRAYGDGVIGPCDPGISSCPEGSGIDATVTGISANVLYWGTEIPSATSFEKSPPVDCGNQGDPPNTTPSPCWIDAGNLGDFVPTIPANEDPYEETNYSQVGGLITPHGTLVMFSDAEMNDSNPFRQSSENFGIQGVVSAFDTFTDHWAFSLPDVGITVMNDNLDGEFTNEFLKYPVGFLGAPYYR